MEVERFWNTGRFTWAALFFHLNRYFSLFGHIPVVVEFFFYSTADNKGKVSGRDRSQYSTNVRWTDVGFLISATSALGSRQFPDVAISNPITNIFPSLCRCG